MNKALNLDRFWLLQLAAFTVFLGRAWQHLVWDAPYRSLFWEEAWMKPVIEGITNYTWEAYVKSSGVDRFIQGLIQGSGWLYVLAGIAVLLVHRYKKTASIFIFLGSINLIFLAFLYCKEHFFFVAQFFEYTLQWGSPLFLIFWLHYPEKRGKVLFWMKIAIALTFTCHGLYALNIYPRPGYFTEMCMNILGLPEAQAIQFLNLVGILDFALSVLIFLPIRKLQLIGLGYAVFWGFFTSIARIWAYFHIEFWQSSLKQWLHESIYRFPHFLIPLFVLLIVLRVFSPRTTN